MNKVLDEIVPIMFLLLAAFFLWGVGYLIALEANLTKKNMQECVKAEMQWVGKNCVK